MANQGDRLNLLFHALADPTRRAVLQQLGQGPASVKDLANPFDMALPSFMQHLNVLERGGLVRSHKKGRVRTFEVVPSRFAEARTWLEKQQALWEGRLDRLDDVLREMQTKESEHDR